tara:strand:- start:33438 stop:34469 length:1032 start_codon:yes stop_codon:yes gene_type:complete
MISFNARQVGADAPPYIIAEACINHGGDIIVAKEMVHAAAAADADAIKFQFHVLDDEMLRNTPQSDNFEIPLYDALEQTNLSIEEHLEIKVLCKSLDIDYMCTPFSRASADVLLREIGIDVFKVGSGELTNLPFQRHMAKSGVPMIVSTGMSEVEEIDETVDLLRSFDTSFALMHCVSIYPCPYERVNLQRIPAMIERYQVPVGLSCHTPSIYTAFGAVALGARIIEKHLSLDRSLPGPDHSSSIEPDELAEMVKGCRAIFAANGAERTIFPEEKQIVAWARESVVSVVDIPAGAVIAPDMIGVKRPSPGEGVLAAREFDLVIGRRALVDIVADRQILKAEIE